MLLNKNKSSSDIYIDNDSDISPPKKITKKKPSPNLSDNISLKIQLNKRKTLAQICQEWYQNKLNNPLNPINPQTEYAVKQMVLNIEN